MLHNYKNETMNYLNISDADQAQKKLKGNKTTRSPTGQTKKKGQNKLNVIYKQLCEKIKVLQITSQNLYDKNTRIKEYEQKVRAELAEMQRRVEDRERKLQEKERQLEQREQQAKNQDPDQSLKRSLKTDDIFEYGGKNEYSEIIQQLRSIDTRK
jgi:flagellar capping protein FliD